MIQGALTATLGTIVSQAHVGRGMPVEYYEVVANPDGRDFEASGLTIIGTILSQEIVGTVSALTGSSVLGIDDDQNVRVWQRTTTAALPKNKDTSGTELHPVANNCMFDLQLAIADSGKQTKLRLYMKSEQGALPNRDN